MIKGKEKSFRFERFRLNLPRRMTQQDDISVKKIAIEMKIGTFKWNETLYLKVLFEEKLAVFCALHQQSLYLSDCN